MRYLNTLLLALALATPALTACAMTPASGMGPAAPFVRSVGELAAEPAGMPLALEGFLTPSAENGNVYYLQDNTGAIPVWISASQMNSMIGPRTYVRVNGYLRTVNAGARMVDASMVTPLAHL